MTRFDATEPAERRKLYVDAIAAHRERESTFLTFEADDAVLEADADGTDETETTPGSEDGLDDAPPAELGVPWIQFGDGTVNLDCTDAELETLKTVIGEFSAFKIDELIRPEEAEGSTPGSARRRTRIGSPSSSTRSSSRCMIYRQGFASGSPRCERPSSSHCNDSHTDRTAVGRSGVQ